MAKPALINSEENESTVLPPGCECLPGEIDPRVRISPRNYYDRIQQREQGLLLPVKGQLLALPQGRRNLPRVGNALKRLSGRE